MWAIRILNGPQTGQVFQLRPGKNVLGRGPSCDVKILSQGISKEHAQIFVTEDKLIVTDLNSRNGTFVNGTKIQNQRLANGDKLSFHEVLADVVFVTQPTLYGVPLPSVQPQIPAMGLPQPDVHQTQSAPAVEDHAPVSAPRNLLQSLIHYLDDVAMPGVYQVAKMFDYRWVLGALVVIYIFTVTTIAMLPTIGMIKSSVRDESLRRAVTIARNLAAMNRQALIEQRDVSVTTRPAEIEDGVTAALIVNARDGSIIAPVQQRGSFADKSFVARVWRSEKPLASVIDSSTVAASEPIIAYNADLSAQVPIAHAVIFYDLNTTATPGGLIFGLYVQIFTIALIFGLLLFFVLFRLVENPISELNAQLDDALREGRSDLSTNYQFPRLIALIANINSTLSRVSFGDGANRVSQSINREPEAMNLVGMFRSAALAINSIDERIIVSNASFDQLIGGGVDLRGRGLAEIPDSALQLNLKDLIVKMRSSPELPAIAEIPFMGEPHQIRAQAVLDTEGHPAYYIVCIQKLYEEAS